MSELDARARQTLAAYTEKVRPFLGEQDAAGLEPLDQLAAMLESALSRPEHVRVGFVGEAQVGKSTLINAVLGRTVLPSGGIGPLTARATRVHWADEDQFRVKYHSRGKLNALRFGLTRFLERRGDIPPEAAKSVASDRILADDQAAEELEGSEQTRERGEYMLAQVKRMLGLDGAGREVAPEVLLDTLRHVLGQKAKGAAASLAPVLERADQLKELVGSSEEVHSSKFAVPKEFDQALKLRAAGWMSPLVAELDVGLSSSDLRGLSIVDLPGIANVADPAGRAALEFVEDDGHALVIVFRNNGVAESIASLLEQSGVVTKLLFGGSAGVEPIHLLLAVTHLDDVARTRFAELTNDAVAQGEEPPTRDAVFNELAAEMTNQLKVQLEAVLRRSESFEGLTGDALAAREEVVRRICDSMNVICVAAPDYLSIKNHPGLGLQFLTRFEDTGVPELRDALVRLVNAAAARRSRDVAERSRSLNLAMRDHLAAIGGIYRDGGGTALEKWRGFQDRLRNELPSLQREMQGLHGEVMGTLRRGLLERIQTLCADAKEQGGRRLASLTRRSRKEVHYQSLFAALRHDGVWERRSVNYPNSLTFAVLDAVASEWEPRIVEAVRTEIRLMADRDLKLVGRLVDRALELDARIVAESQIENQKRILQQHSRSAVAWTKEHLDELTVRVQAKLREVIAPPIEKACRRAIQAGRHRGRGAKECILESFEEGGMAALEEARRGAEQVLKEAYRGMLRKLETGFLKEHHDPVQAAFEALTDEAGRRAKRSNAQVRSRVLKALDECELLLDSIDEFDGEVAA